MTREYADQWFTIDLRPKRRRRQVDAPLDSWTAHASPLEHYQLVTADCRALADAMRDECRVAEWEHHLTICPNCNLQTALAAVRSESIA